MTTTSLYLDPAHPNFARDPYAQLAALRRTAPVHWSPALKGWTVLQYDAVRHVLSNPTHSADTFTTYYQSLSPERQSQTQSLLRFLGNWLVFIDPPRHIRMRRITAKVFTTHALQKIETNVVSIVDHLLADMQRDAASGQTEQDLVARFSNPLPAYVIMDMLGVPRALLPEMKQWSDDIKLFIGVALNAEDKYTRATQGVDAMADAFRALIAAHRANPEDDILSLLIAARDDEADGSALTDDEIIATAILFLFAGHETTTNLVTMASLAMMRDEPLRQTFLGLDQPAQIELAVEEFLRHDGPTPIMMRVANVDHDLGDQHIKKGERVFPVIASANRDESVFENPDQINFSRTPNRHLTFGYGTHFCLGAPLARMEAKIALPKLHKTFPTMAATQPPVWADGYTLRGPTHLPVRLC